MCTYAYVLAGRRKNHVGTTAGPTLGEIDSLVYGQLASIGPAAYIAGWGSMPLTSHATASPSSAGLLLEAAAGRRTY